jgi:hypothetical protein
MLHRKQKLKFESEEKRVTESDRECVLDTFGFLGEIGGQGLPIISMEMRLISTIQK